MFPLRESLVVFLALACGAVGTSIAQDRDMETRVYPLADTLDVQGERIALDPMRIPAAATLLTASDWKTARAASLDEALESVPGVIAQSRSGGQDVRITNRGFGARGAGERSNAGTTRGIRVNLDGFPLSEPDGRTSLDFADIGLLSSIRVLRSNSSALYGPASGGVIDLYSTSRFDHPFAEARAEFGSFGFTRQQAEVGFLTGVARTELSVSTSNFDGWRDHSGGSQTTIMASMQAEPSPRTALGLFLTATRNLQRQAGALTQTEFDDTPRAADPAYVSQNARRDNRIGRVGVKLDQQLGEGQILRVTGFVEPKTIHRSERNRYRDFQRVHTGGSGLISLPIAVGATRARWTTGVDDAFQDGTVLFYNLDNGSRGTDLIANQREGINVFGVFSELMVTPAAKLELTAGARWDAAYLISENHTEPQLDDTRTLKRASPRFAASYRLKPDHSLYATVSGGIENPAFNEIDPPAPYDTLTSLNPFLEPAHSMTYEIGAKGQTRFGRGLDVLHYDVAVYTLEVNNDIIPFNAGAFYRTAGKSRRTGLELGLGASTDYGLSARVAATFSDNKYIDYVTNAPVDGGGFAEVDYGDNESAGVPPQTLNASLRYEHAKGPFLEGAVRRVGEYFANDANTERVEAYTIFDLTVGADHRFGSNRVGLFVSGRNLSDEKYAASAYVNGVNGRYLEPGMERNVVVGLSVRADRTPR